MKDVSPDFRYNKQDTKTLAKILPYEGTGEAVKVFTRYAYRLSDYGYWFMLSTLWVSYTGWSDLEQWKALFRSTRANRQTSIMKPSEVDFLFVLPPTLLVYRAHRPDETDWISYTISPEKAAQFAAHRGVDQVKEYLVDKEDVLALFLRRGEFEVLVLDQSKAVLVRQLQVVRGEAQ